MLVLASASPRRHQLLEAAGIVHRVQPASVPEVLQPDEDGVTFARRLAVEKAGAVQLDEGDIGLGADTVVCLDTEVLGKPIDDGDARRMLRLLSGRQHWVHTGICLRTSKTVLTDLASTAVEFARLTEEEIAGYVQSGEGKDKAGGYAIQGLASRFVERIEGCYHNVVGLPIALVYRHLRTLKYL
jgi:septum formation protein